MRVRQFLPGSSKKFKNLAPGDVFFGGVSGTDLYVKLTGVPDPDPATGLAVRITDGQVNGIGKEVDVNTVAGIFIPTD